MKEFKDTKDLYTENYRTLLKIFYKNNKSEIIDLGVLSTVFLLICVKKLNISWAVNNVCFSGQIKDMCNNT